jgi:hypothetical protein
MYRNLDLIIQRNERVTNSIKQRMQESTVSIKLRDQQNDKVRENHVAMTRRIKWLLFVLITLFVLDLVALLVIKL